MWSYWCLWAQSNSFKRENKYFQSANKSLGVIGALGHKLFLFFNKGAVLKDVAIGNRLSYPSHISLSASINAICRLEICNKCTTSQLEKEESESYRCFWPRSTSIIKEKQIFQLFIFWTRGC